MVLNPFLLEHYNVQIKGKVEMSSTLHYILVLELLKSQWDPLKKKWSTFVVRLQF